MLTPEQAERIVAAAYREDAKLERSLGGPFARLAFASGLRTGEIAALEYGAHGLDLDAGGRARTGVARPGARRERRLSAAAAEVEVFPPRRSAPSRTP